MADPVARPRVELNNKQVESQIDSITEKVKELKKQFKQALETGDKEALPGLKKQLNEHQRELKQLKKEVISVDSVLKNLNGATFNQLKKAYEVQSSKVRNLAKGTKEYRQEVEKLKSLKGAMAGFNSDLGAQEGIFKKLANGFNNYFGIITAGIASLTGVVFSMRQAVDAANERESTKDELKAITGLGDEAADKLEKAAVLAATTTDQNGIRITQSADDILQAYKLMGSAKPELLSNADALAGVTKEALILAEASKMEAGPAVESLASIMNQFGAGSDQASKYVNILAAGSQAGAAEVTDLADSIIRSGAAANQANVSIEEEVGLIEALAEKGVKAEKAGTGLKTFLLKLQAGADDTNPAVVGMSQALENLAAKNLTAAQMTDLFGMESYTVAALLINNRNRFNELTKAVTGTNIAYEQAAINTSNNTAKLAQAKNKIHENTIELGKMLQPAMTHVVSTGSLMLKTLIVLVGFLSKYGKQIILVSAVIAAYTIAINASIIADKLKVFWTDKVVKAVSGLWKVLSKNPWMAIAAAIALAVIALSNWIKKTDQASDAQRELNKLIKEGNDLLASTKSIDERISVLSTLSKKQLKQLKGDIEGQLSAEKEYNTKLLVELKKRLNADAELKRLYKERDAQETTDIQRAFIQTQIRHRQEELASDLQAEADKHDASVKQLNKYLGQIDIAYETARDDEDKSTEEHNGKKKGEEEDLQKALWELRQQYGLIKQIELYNKELAEFKANKASKLLTEEEYQRALKKIHDKYFPTPKAIEIDDSGDSESMLSDTNKSVDESKSIGTKRAEADLDYNIEKDKQTLDGQYALLELQWERGEIGWTEYYDRLTELDNQYTKTVVENLTAGLEHTANIARSVLSIQSSRLEKEKSREIANAGSSAEKKEEIEIKYRKKQKELALKQAAIDIALAEIKAVASAPFPYNIPAIIEATAAGIATIAAIEATEYKVGGYTGDDGDASTVAGLVHKKEFVANAQATANPSVKKVLDIIDLAQQNGTIRTLDLAGAVSNFNKTRGFASGGYASKVQTKDSGSTSIIDLKVIENAANSIMVAAQIFASKNLTIDASGVKKITEAGEEIKVQKGHGSR